MHELAVTNAILKTVLAHARRARAKRVHRVRLVVGELSGFESMWLARCFATAARGTVAERARLEVEAQAPEFTCRSCGIGFSVSLRAVERVRCGCGSADCELVTAPDYLVEEIEVS